MLEECQVETRRHSHSQSQNMYIVSDLLLKYESKEATKNSKSHFGPNLKQTPHLSQSFINIYTHNRLYYPASLLKFAYECLNSDSHLLGLLLCKWTPLVFCYNNTLPTRALYTRFKRLLREYLRHTCCYGVPTNADATAA